MNSILDKILELAVVIILAIPQDIFINCLVSWALDYSSSNWLYQVLIGIIAFSFAYATYRKLLKKYFV